MSRYRVNKNLLKDELREKFYQLTFDDETEEFIASCLKRSDLSWKRYLCLIFLWPILRLFMSVTSLYGLFECGAMFLFSREHLKQFLSYRNEKFAPLINEDKFIGDNLLDIGAGDGNITSKLSPFFRHTYVTEKSSTMQKRLTERNYINLDADNWFDVNDPITGQPIKFEIISYLNVLDR